MINFTNLLMTFRGIAFCDKNIRILWFKILISHLTKTWNVIFDGLES